MTCSQRFNWEYHETVINSPSFKVICLYCEHFPPDACNKVVILCTCALRVIHCPSRQTQQIDAIGQLAIIWVDCRWRVRPRYGVETNWWEDGEGRTGNGRDDVTSSCTHFCQEITLPSLCIVGPHIGTPVANENIYIDQITLLPR